MNAAQARPNFVKAMINREPFSPMPGVPPATPADVLLEGLDGSILEQYEAVSLVDIRFDQKELLAQRALQANVLLQVREEFDEIFIGSRVFDARQIGLPAGDVPDQPYKIGEKGMWLVQFIGPVKSEWLDAVKAEGVVVGQYIPYNAFLVAASNDQIRAIGEFRYVQWTMQMHRFLKSVIPPEPGTYVRARVFLGQTDQTESTVAVLANLSREPLERLQFSEAELNIFGVFRADQVDFILSQPLVWGFASVEVIAVPTDIPTLSLDSLVALIVVLAAVGLVRLRSG